MRKGIVPKRYIDACEENQKTYGYPECIMDCEIPKSIKRELNCKAKPHLAKKYRKERSILKKWEI